MLNIFMHPLTVLLLVQCDNMTNIQNVASSSGGGGNFGIPIGGIPITLGATFNEANSKLTELR